MLKAKTNKQTKTHHNNKNEQKVLYPVNYPLNVKENTFAHNQKLGKFGASWLVLQEMWKEVIYREGN